MGNISVQVINEKDFRMVLSMLKALEDNKIIRMTADEDDFLSLPGAPVSDEQLLDYLEKAEAEEDISEAEAKAIFDSMRSTRLTLV